MVWTDELLAAFLDYTADEAPELHPMLHLMAYRGTRRQPICRRRRLFRDGLVNRVSRTTDRLPAAVAAITTAVTRRPPLASGIHGARRRHLTPRIMATRHCPPSADGSPRAGHRTTAQSCTAP
jgi:hypothetical protein